MEVINDKVDTQGSHKFIKALHIAFVDKDIS